MKQSKTIRLLVLMNFLFIVLAVGCRILYQETTRELFLSLYVTFFTISYHFLMRLMVGEGITLLYRNRDFHYESIWFRQHSFEPKLYSILGVKKWKLHLITAKPEQFDLRQRSFQELRKNMTQAELVHEIIMVLSFVPLLLIPRYGASAVFITTSILACLADSLFVIIQRYNRPRVLRLKAKEEQRKERNHGCITKDA